MENSLNRRVAPKFLKVDGGLRAKTDNYHIRSSLIDCRHFGRRNQSSRCMKEWIKLLLLWAAADWAAGFHSHQPQLDASTLTKKNSGANGQLGVVHLSYFQY